LLELKRHCRRSIDSLCASLQTIDKHPLPSSIPLLRPAGPGMDEAYDGHHVR
jgi:hypothetical protein